MVAECQVLGDRALLLQVGGGCVVRDVRLGVLSHEGLEQAAHLAHCPNRSPAVVLVILG